jgi:hypothetical protein
MSARLVVRIVVLELAQDTGENGLRWQSLVSTIRHFRRQRLPLPGPVARARTHTRRPHRRRRPDRLVRAGSTFVVAEVDEVGLGDEELGFLVEVKNRLLLLERGGPGRWRRGWQGLKVRGRRRSRTEA